MVENKENAVFYTTGKPSVAEFPEEFKAKMTKKIRRSPLALLPALEENRSVEGLPHPAKFKKAMADEHKMEEKKWTRSVASEFLKEDRVIRLLEDFLIYNRILVEDGDQLVPAADLGIGKLTYFLETVFADDGLRSLEVVENRRPQAEVYGIARVKSRVIQPHMRDI